MRETIAALLLGVAALLVVIGSAAMLVVRGALDRLHLVTLAATPATVAVVAAVFVSEGFGQTAFTALLIGVALLSTSAVAASATARVALRVGGRDEDGAA